LEKRQKCMETWQACLNKATLEPDLIEDLLMRNTWECKDIAASQINSIENGKSKPWTCRATLNLLGCGQYVFSRLTKIILRVGYRMCYD
jgi:hypothetical protein